MALLGEADLAALLPAATASHQDVTTAAKEEQEAAHLAEAVVVPTTVDPAAAAVQAGAETASVPTKIISAEKRHEAAVVANQDAMAALFGEAVVVHVHEARQLHASACDLSCMHKVQHGGMHGNVHACDPNK